MTAHSTSPCFMRLTVTALEDLHTGTGTGSGDIDALVQRDRRGWPVIRASHFRGLLREAGEDGNFDEKELNLLLGAPGASRGALRLTSLRAIEDRQTLVWGSTKRREGERAPEADTLRFIEHVAAGTCFEARLRLPDASLQALLEQLLDRVDRIGGDRNRGSGLVKLDWHPWVPPVAQRPMIAGGAALCLVLRNLEPLCLPVTGHPGNLIRTQSFIRGQTLRGALMAWAVRHGRPESVGLFARVSVGDALPLPEGATAADRVVPIPLSILTEKARASGADLPWWAGGALPAVESDGLGEARRSDEKPKRPDAHEYLIRLGDSGPWRRYRPTMQVRLRNATPRRGSREDAELFSLEEIAEETRFQAELRFADPEAARDFLAAFAPLCDGDWLAIGRGGQPAIVESLTVFQGVATQTGSDRPFADAWTLTLTSDLILRGETLGFLDRLDLDRLCQLAGIPGRKDWTIDKAFVESEAVYGFNAVSGLQRAPVLAIRRGSCWRVTGPGSAELARALAKRPALGERTAEGFGRFSIDLQPVSESRRWESGSGEPPVNRNEALLALARQLAGKIEKNGPSLSQLQWLRERALAAETPAQIDQLLHEIETAPERRPQGGQKWSGFRPVRLREALARFPEIAEKRQLVSYLVQWRVPQEKENRR